MEQTLLDVRGMTCPSCVRHVQRALSGVEGVCEVEVRLAEGHVRIDHDPLTRTDALIEALRDAGYPDAVRAGETP